MRSRLAAGTIALVVLAGINPASAQVPDWPSERPPKPLAARDVKFPPYAIKTLPNGLQVIAVSHHEQPSVSIRLMVRAGGAQDPVDKPGVASLAAALLDQGTTTRSAEQIAHTIDSIGGLIGSGSATEYTFLYTIVSTRRFSAVKYFCATRCTSAAVMFMKMSNSPSAVVMSSWITAACASVCALSLCDSRLRM